MHFVLSGRGLGLLRKTGFTPDISERLRYTVWGRGIREA